MVIDVERIVQDLKKMNVGKLLENVELKNYTSYKVGGICRVMVFPKSISLLVKLIKYLKENNVKYMVLGNGSNVLFSDEVYDGVIIKLSEFSKVSERGNLLICGAGCNLMKVALMACKKGYSGLEFATGIPGTIGGAVYMNAGAYKSDMGYVVKRIKVLTPDYRVITMVNNELDFHYRTSFLKTHKDYICLEATIMLKKGNKEEIEELVKTRRERRIESQPLEYPSAGSVFRNPTNDFAGRLIEELGFKGLIKGGAMVSQKHANFVINYKDATADDIKDLIDFLKEQVKEKFNVDLKVEQEFVNWEHKDGEESKKENQNSLA